MQHKLQQFLFCSSFFFLCFVISKEMGLQLAIFFPFVATGVHKVIFGQKLVSLLGPSTSICIGNRGRPFRFNLMQEWGKNSPGLCQFVCKIINYFKKLIFLIQLKKCSEYFYSQQLNQKNNIVICQKIYFFVSCDTLKLKGRVF